jgi:hypothetical protein
MSHEDNRDELPISNTPEGMFPKDFDVYTTEDAATDMLRHGSPLEAAELINGPIGPLPPVSVGRNRFTSEVALPLDPEMLQQIHEEAEIENCSSEAVIRGLIQDGFRYREAKYRQKPE